MAPFLTLSTIQIFWTFKGVVVKYKEKPNWTYKNDVLSVAAVTILFFQNDKCDIDVWEGLKHPVSYCNALEIVYMYSAPNLNSPFKIFKIGNIFDESWECTISILIRFWLSERIQILILLHLKDCNFAILPIFKRLFSILEKSFWNLVCQRGLFSFGSLYLCDENLPRHVKDPFNGFLCLSFLCTQVHFLREMPFRRLRDTSLCYTQCFISNC